MPSSRLMIVGVSSSGQETKGLLSPQGLSSLIEWNVAPSGTNFSGCHGSTRGKLNADNVAMAVLDDPSIGTDVYVSPVDMIVCDTDDWYESYLKITSSKYRKR